MSGAALDPASLETAVRFVARIFAEELARAFAPQLAASPARPTPEEALAPAPVAPAPSVPSASTATRPPRFGLRPPDAIGEDEDFGSALRFLEERAGETRALFGGAPLAPAHPEPAPEPTIGDVFALGRPPIR